MLKGLIKQYNKLIVESKLSNFSKIIGLETEISLLLLKYIGDSKKIKNDASSI